VDFEEALTSMEAKSHGAGWLVVPGLILYLAAACSPPDDSCHPRTTTTPVGWTEQTPLGSPEALFSRFSGSCQAPFHWDASGWGAGTVTVEPPQGQSTLTATVALDLSSASWVTQSGTGMCPPSALAVQGTVTLELLEGEVVHQQPVTIGAVPGMTPTRLNFGLEEGGWGSWVSIRKTDPQSSISMLIEVTPLAEGCSGQMILNWQNRSGSGAVGIFATWSDTN
jgi:hypothetical protein